MKKTALLTIVVLTAGILAVASCRRSDVRTVVINVPRMADARSVRIVTNAALDEIIGRYDGTKNDYEIDVSKRLVLYHESQKLQLPEYRRRIEARIREVGFNAQVVAVRWNPPPPVPTMDGPFQMWPDRFTAVISVPEMASNTAANVVVDAIAYARLGRDDSRISVRRDSRQIVAAYESLYLAPRNVEYAIACAGFDANDTAANLGSKDSIPHGWTPVKL